MIETKEKTEKVEYEQVVLSLAENYHGHIPDGQLTPAEAMLAEYCGEGCEDYIDMLPGSSV